MNGKVRSCATNKKVCCAIFIVICKRCTFCNEIIWKHGALTTKYARLII
jgi:hypothetical protein